MQVFGVDFTSAPSAQKPITRARCRFEGGALICEGVDRLASLAAFEAALAAPGPWIMGADFPFTFASGLAEALGWPPDWPALAAHLGRLERQAFEATLAAHRRAAPAGQKHLYRAIDRLAGGAAPNNIVNPPVGKMLFEGIPRLLASGVSVPGLAIGDPARRVVEAYPALAAEGLIGTRTYKDGKPEDQTARLAHRRALLAALAGADGKARFGFVTRAPDMLADDPKGDMLDALICAVQACWAHVMGLARPEWAELAQEGWIADPAAFCAPLPRSPS